MKTLLTFMAGAAAMQFVNCVWLWSFCGRLRRRSAKRREILLKAVAVRREAATTLDEFVGTVLGFPPGGKHGAPD